MSDISAPCLRDGRPAAPQEHHGRPDDPSQGKGMGGAKDWPEHARFPLCAKCHRELHEKRWTFRVVGGMVEILAPGDDQWVIGRRGLVLKDSTSNTNKLFWSDLALARGWADADSDAVSAFQKQCEIADALRERYAHTTHKWYDRAAEILSSYRGKHVHPRRVYERVHLMATFGPTEEHPKGRWEDMEKLGMTVALAVAKQPAEDRPAALEKALDLNAEFTPALQIAAAIKGDPAESAKACEEHEWRCRKCGADIREEGA